MKEELRKYLTNGYYNRLTSLTALMLGSFGEKLNCPKVSFSNDTTISNKKKEYKIEKYQLQNTTAIKIREYLNKNTHPAISKAIVVGSIADNTENGYSDFDGILIIDIDKLSNKSDILSLRKIIKESNLLMKSQDALQHHGWMIIEKKELNNYNENHLPSEIFSNSKMLYPEMESNLEIFISQAKANSRNFHSLINSIVIKINNKEKLHDFYYFKNLISELLLTPAVFLQSVKLINCSKRDSFNLIDQHISAKSRSTLKEIEKLRANWDQSGIDIEKQIKAEVYGRIPILKSEGARTPKEYIQWIESNHHLIEEYISELKQDQ